MPQPKSTGIIRASVLDRLIDEAPKIRSEAMPTVDESSRNCMDALRRDLESLLNTRRIADDPPETNTELRRSTYMYGLPDISSMGTLSTIDQNRLLKAVESAIAIFEPRLTRVKVTLRPVAKSGRMLHFLIEGLLQIDPAPQHIVFDTLLELGSGSYQIQGGSGAR